MKNNTLIILLLLFSIQLYGDRYITRGHQQGELYIASSWFQYVDTATVAIFLTDDHGQSLSMRYYYAQNSGGMPVGRIVTDYSPGVLYNETLITLWRSFDSGYTWEIISIPGPYGRFSSGNISGQIYEVFTNEPLWRIELHRSENYAGNFIIVDDSMVGRPEVCNTAEGLYLYHYRYDNNDLVIKYSSNYGQSFATINTLDSTISGFSSDHCFPSFSRGTMPGELYLTTLFENMRFKVFYSQNYGLTFEQKYESPVCDFNTEHYSFTAGLEPGSFYYSKEIPLYHLEANTLLCIYYSSDTAKTFTEYCHILDTGFPVSVPEPTIDQHTMKEIGVYPNPFNSQMTLRFQMPVSATYSIELVNLSGQAVLRKEEFFDTGQQTITLQTGHLAPGVYLCSIKYQGKVLGVSKIVKGR